MRLIPALTLALGLGAAAQAHAQSAMLHASGGPTLVDRGYSLAGGAAWLPLSRLSVGVSVERTHLFTRVRGDGRSTSAFRGGTLTVGTAELQLSLFPRARWTPYLLAGGAAGRSRPNVNATFPAAVTNDVRAVFAGGGIHVPLGANLAVFADARMMVGDEANELLAVAPLRAGLSWRF
jgi:hypothetical protein